MVKRAQEEIVGFAMIIIIVVIVILFLLVFSLRNNSAESVQSYEADSFVQSALQYTTNCEGYRGNYSVQDLIFLCANEENCTETVYSCDVLNSTINGILDASWNVGSGSAVQGYDFDILTNGVGLISTTKGNQTGTYKGALEDLAKGSYSAKIVLKVYY